MQNKNLVGCIEGFKDHEITFLCHIINLFSAEHTAKAHPGSIVFFNIDYVIQVLKDYLKSVPNDTPRERQVKKMLEKMGDTYEGDSVTFQMRLNDSKVYRTLGRDGNTLRLPVVRRVEAGIRWQEFGKKYIKPEVSVNQYIHCERIRKQWWKITCPKESVDWCKNYLHEKYSATD